MAAEAGWKNDPLARRLLQQGAMFSFFQAVQLLHRLSSSSVPVGHQGPASQEWVRFRPDLSLSFAASDITAITESADGRAIEIATTFLSLYGASSPLPTFYTEDLFADNDESLVRGFLDLFHHRAISLFFRTWEKYRHPIRFRPLGQDAISRCFLALMGHAAATLTPGLHAVRLLASAGLWTQQPHSALALRGVVGDYFADVPVEIDQCVGQWLDIPIGQRSMLGQANCTLGVDVMAGERMFDRSTTFRVRLGPLSRSRFQDFLPSGKSIAELREIVDLFNIDRLDYEIEVLLAEPEVPELRLSGESAFLGWSTWLLSGRAGQDRHVRFLVRG